MEFAMELKGWGEHVGEEARKNFGRWLEDGFIAQYLLGNDILDIGFEGYVENVTPIMPKAIGVGLNYPGYDGRVLPFTDASQDTVFASHCLEHIEDYRTVIADWFRVLRVGGFLIIAVPHQFLYERNLRLPSRFNIDHRRFYTPASLLREVEEAIDPVKYRVRLLEDNDKGFDYAIEPKNHAGGSYEVLLVIEKIATPPWADLLVAPPKIDDISPGTFSSLPRPGASSPTIAITSTPCPMSIISFKMDHLGDFILAMPAFANLRRAFPFAFLTLVCGAWNVGEALATGLFDEVLTFSVFERNAVLNQVTPMHERIAALRT
jgi:SAM-dependent methyltransferase